MSSTEPRGRIVLAFASIYLIWGGLESRFLRANPGVVCAMLDGMQTCVTPDAPARFREALRAHQTR